MENSSRVWHSVATTLVTFIVVTVINFGAGLLIFIDDGEASVGPPISFGGKTFATLDITNFSKYPIMGLQLNIPTNTSLSEVQISAPVTLTKNLNARDSKKVYQVELSNIPSNTKTRIVIPIKNEILIHQITVPNARSKKIKMVEHNEIENPIVKIIKDAILLAAVYAIVLGVFNFYTRIKIEEFNSEIRELRTSMERADEKMEDVNDAMAELKSSTARVKLYLSSQISSYSKELEFWRDTLRKLIYLAGEEKLTAERIIESVTKSLKTYSIKSGSDLNIDEIYEIYEMMANRARNQDSGT